MTRTLKNRALSFSRLKRGYSLFEVMIVLAIMALAMSVIMPRAAASLDKVVAHTVFFDFQRQLLDLRGKAFATNEALTVLSSADTQGAPETATSGQVTYGLSSTTRFPAESNASDAGPATVSDATPEFVEPNRIALRAGWSYHLTAPIRISAGGACTRADVDVFNGGHKVMHLESQIDGCKLLRSS